MIYRSRLPNAEIADRPRRRHELRILQGEVADDESTARPVSVDENPTVLGNWGSVAESVAVLAAQGAGIPGADAAAKVIQALIGIEDAQSVMLKRIRRDVELLRMGPFRAAQEQLAIAHRKGRINAEYGRHLQEAEDLLVQAVAQAATIEEASVIRSTWVRSRPPAVMKRKPGTVLTRVTVTVLRLLRN